MMMTGRVGFRSLTFCNSSIPLSPGIRISDTSTRGVPSSSARRHSRADPKARTSKPSRVSARSSTQRIDWSSSTIQTEFMCLT